MVLDLCTETEFSERVNLIIGEGYGKWPTGMGSLTRAGWVRRHRHPKDKQRLFPPIEVRRVAISLPPAVTSYAADVKILLPGRMM